MIMITIFILMNLMERIVRTNKTYAVSEAGPAKCSRLLLDFFAEDGDGGCLEAEQCGGA
jgi:hypothetical protein